MNRRLRTFHIGPGHRAHHMRIYHRICLSLAAHGYGVSLIAHPDDGASTENNSVDFQFFNTPYSPSLQWELAKRWNRCVVAYQAALASSADIFHFYSPEFIPWAIKLRKRTKKPVIMDCMEDFEGYVWQRPNIPAVLRLPLARLVRYGLQKAAREFDAITVADDSVKNMFEAWGARVVTLYNFPRLDLFPDLPSITQDFDLVFHGSMSTYDLRAFLDIDDALVSKGAHLRWYLFGSMEEPDWFKREIAQRNASERFTLRGLIPHNQVGMQVQRARIGIIPLPNLPKYHCNIPQKLFEYMALRMPVVLSDLPPSRPFVGDGRCALMVEPDNPHAYSEAILKLLANPMFCSSMGAEGRKRVEQMYNWEVESKKLFALYEELCDF